MSNYRNSLTLGESNGKRVFILQCNKSEKKSVIKHHHSDGSTSWLSEWVATKHTDGKPKILHIPIPSEGIFEIYGQPNLAGLYCIYSGVNGRLYYTSIGFNEKNQLIIVQHSGGSLRQELLKMGKKNIF
ncbi:hypothetical protein [Enterobacter hormaechei]